MSAPRLTAAQAKALGVLAETDVGYARARYRRGDNDMALSIGGGAVLDELTDLGLTWRDRSRWSGHGMTWRWSITDAGRQALAAYKETHDAHD